MLANEDQEVEFDLLQFYIHRADFGNLLFSSNKFPNTLGDARGKIVFIVKNSFVGSGNPSVFYPTFSDFPDDVKY